MPNISSLKTLLATSFALVAFAANSVFCRLALGEISIDASSFTIIRLLSGAAVLLLILKLFGKKTRSVSKGSWQASAMLFIYAATFSFAYISLETGTGALILFGSVQLTMLTITVISGNRLRLLEWVGVLIALVGFVYLVLPKVTTPSFSGFLLMATSGIAWGSYTLMGRKSTSPLSDTTYNFTRTLPLIIVLGIFFIQSSHLSQTGVIWAVSSGVLASGIGYTIWYTALGGLSATVAAIAQLLVPVIAALGGLVFVSEPISLRFLFSAAMILGGIALVILGKSK